MSDWSDPVRDRYRLDECLSEDEDARAWRATEPESGQTVILRHRASLPARRQLLEARLEAIGGLHHPALLASGEIATDSGLILQRPWLPHRLSDKINEWSPEDRLAAGIRVAEVLQAAHGAGVIHGALHAGNVLLDEKQRLRIVDFALPGAPPRDEGSWLSPQRRAGSAPEAPDDLYALGVLLYSWLLGDDPGRPLPEAARLEELKARRRAGGHVPAVLARVLAALLSADPGHRPRSALQVSEMLDDARLAMRRSAETGLEESEDAWLPRPGLPIEPTSEPAESESDGRFSLARVLVPVAAVVVVLGLVMVLFVLPANVQRDETARQAEAAALAKIKDRIEQARARRLAEADEKRELTPEELEAMLARKQAAEAVLDDFINLRIELEERFAERWGGEEWATAQTFRPRGDELFRQQLYDQAASLYLQGFRALKTVEALGELNYVEAMERGKRALARGRSGLAREAYRRAALIHPDSELATGGLDRAENLDQVLELMARADGHAEAGDWAEALTALEQVRAIDPLTEGIDVRIQQTRQTIADVAFRSAMSDGLAAMENGRWARARSHLERARDMRPSDSAPKDALLEVERRFREASIQHHRDQALDAVDAEDWAKAVEHFESILETDPNLRFAQEGRDRAVARADLDRRLVRFTGAPHRWWSEEGRDRAARLLEEARKVKDGGSRLSRQLGILSGQLDLASRHIDVTLVSDNACNVVVYKVGRLGQFDRHSIKLQPGRYTAVGTRDGYRDVRREFLVHAERGVDPVVVYCEDEV